MSITSLLLTARPLVINWDAVTLLLTVRFELNDASFSRISFPYIWVLLDTSRLEFIETSRSRSVRPFTCKSFSMMKSPYKMRSFQIRTFPQRSVSWFTRRLFDISRLEFRVVSL